MSIYSQWFVNYFAFENFATIHILNCITAGNKKTKKQKQNTKKPKQKNKTKKISEFTSTKVEMRFKYC